jgi:hypothetical protein
MTFNQNKYGILTNWKRVWFLRRVETENRKTLECFLVELGDPNSISMLKAWVGMVLLADSDWFYSSPIVDRYPAALHYRDSDKAKKEKRTAINRAGNYHVELVNGEYPCRPIDFRLCHFETSYTRGWRNGCVVSGYLELEHHAFFSSNGRNLPVMFKVVDCSRTPAAVESLSQEARAYMALQALQGHVIPKLYGYYEVWGILKMLALQPVGEAIPDNEVINQQLRARMRASLQRIHDAGYVHGDIARRNFCRRGNNIFLVDLERCRPIEADAAANEMNEVDRF